MSADRILVTDSLPAGAFGTSIASFAHRMHESGLFEDEQLVRMIDSHPRDMIAVNTMGDDPGSTEWGDGEIGDLDGAELLDCVKRGHLWLSLRRFHGVHPELTELLDRGYDELEAAYPGFRTTRRDGGLLISSPSAFVHYHVDVPPNVLWHIRGRKRVWAYPLEDHGLLDPEIREAVLARERTEDVPYDVSFDERAEVFDLEPGDVVTWPQNSPHRVENTEGLNVSISSEHFTNEAMRVVRVNRANRWLRNRFGLGTRATDVRGLGYLLKTSIWGAGYLAEKCLGTTTPEFEYPKTFVVDPDAPRCVSPLVPEGGGVEDREPALATV